MNYHTIFLATAITTFLLVRIFVYFSPGKTVTAYLRHKTLFYVHHIYLGIVLLAVTLPLIFKFGPQPILVGLSAIGLSLCLDELSAWLSYSPYPARKEFIATVVLFIVFGLYLLLLK